MNRDLHKELMLHLERGKNQLMLNEPADISKVGEDILKKYTSSPLTKQTTSVLKFVQTHRDSYIELAGLILELKGWLITHQEPSQIKLMVEKRVQDLNVFYLKLLFDLSVIGQGMVTIEEMIEDGAVTLNNAKNIANEILVAVEEVTVFVSQDFVR